MDDKQSTHNRWPSERLALTVGEAAELLGVGRAHLYRYVMGGELRSIKLGRARRIPRDALYEFMERQASSADHYTQHD